MLLAVLDLTTPDKSGFINGAFFTNSSTSSGTGLIDSFVRLQASPVEQGYNSSFRPVQFDETNSFNHDLQLAEIPVTVLGGVPYREFLLDINQSGGGLLSLDKIEVYLSAAGDITAYPFGPLATKVYDLDAGGDNWLRLNAGLSSGSGTSDVLVYLPNSLFDPDIWPPETYLTFYSRFGDNIASNDGFEEWAVSTYGATTLAGYKFEDTDADGEPREPGELGLRDWTVFVDYNDNGVLDAGEPSAVTLADDPATPADEEGRYTIYGIAAGTWKVREVQQTNWINSFPPTSDQYGRYYEFAFPEGQSLYGADFGNYPEKGSLTIAKEADKATVTAAGELITYTITVDNTGNIDLTGVVLTDVFTGGRRW